VLRRYSQITLVTLALLVGVVAVAGPWCLVPLCTKMMGGAGRATMTPAACPTDAGHHLSAACDDMGSRGVAVTAASASKAPVLDDLSAVTVAGLGVPAVTVVRAAYAPPLDEPPRLVLDTSRLRI
jgi:hypothetical protein